MQSVKFFRNPTVWGVGALVMATVLALIAAFLYIKPPGQKVVTFYTDDAASIRAGDEVRIAGITVGKVEDLSLEQNQVRVRAQVDGDAFVGDLSQVQVRMLTVVGGYYVNLVSLGNRSLGANPIPVERVTMPYSLIQTLAQATKITDNLHPQPIKDSLDQVRLGLAGTNLQSLSAIIDAGNSLTSTIDKQRNQLSEILSMSDEYIRSLKDFGDELKQIVRKVSILEATLVVYSKGLGAAITGVGSILQVLGQLGGFYQEHRDEALEKVRDWQAKARFWDDRAGVSVRSLRLMRNKLERVLDAQNAPPELLATDMCIPVPGSAC
jgi:phospholipid/cholesterol/gamma-HCH transport system substrate-binding protein